MKRIIKPRKEKQLPVDNKELQPMIEADHVLLDPLRKRIDLLKNDKKKFKRRDPRRKELSKTIHKLSIRMSSAKFK